MDYLTNKLKSDIRDLKLSIILGENSTEFIPNLNKLRKGNNRFFDQPYWKVIKEWKGKSVITGSSALYAFGLLDRMPPHHNKSVRFIGRTNQSCENSAIKFYQLYESLPFYMKIGVTEIKPKIFTSNSKKTLMKFENGCEIRFSQADNVNGHIDFLIIEDMKDSTVFTNLIPILSSAAGFLIYGLPNNDPVFQQIQLTSKIINHKQYNWNSVPNRDVEWVKQEILNIGGVREFINEYSNGEITPELKIILRDKLIEDLDN